MSELKPCPFCGGKAEIVGTNGGNPFTTWCERCGLEFGVDKDFYLYQLEEAWNRRSDDAVPVVRCATCKECLQVACDLHLKPYGEIRDEVKYD